jgi:hypothetical protein
MGPRNVIPRIHSGMYSQHQVRFSAEIRLPITSARSSVCFEALDFVSEAILSIDVLTLQTLKLFSCFHTPNDIQLHC